MNKSAILALGVLLSACVMEPDLRPDPYLKSEALLQDGLTAYQNDDFILATQKFSRALELYQSFDNQPGIALARINLAETALANSDFAKAATYLQALKQQVVAHTVAPELQYEIALLEVKSQFEQQQYAEALTALQPLLAQLDGKNTLNSERLNLFAMQARLEVLMSPSGTSNALTRFESAVTQSESVSPYYHIVLKRILAVAALKRRDYAIATGLLQQALAYYQTQAQRRAIAACLEELVEIEMLQQHYPMARDYLNRALVIRQWLKNAYKIDKIRQQLQKMDKK